MPKPVRFLTTTVQLPVGDAGIWRVILDLDREVGTWAVADIDGRCNMDSRTIRDFVKRLMAGGKIERAGERPPAPPSNRPALLYRLLARSLEAPRLRRDGTECPEPAIEKMWRVMKMMKAFTVPDVAEAAQVTVTTADRYLRHLAAVKGGPLKATPGRPLRRQYVLVQNLGAHAPKILRGHQVYDPNCRQLLGDMKVEEVAL
ncbi:MAG TPA: hypothetical protein VGN60_08950 [Devosia sp.]|jgi:hypothetical protein|nr:hypothetical protein [Devosia sp.]